LTFENVFNLFSSKLSTTAIHNATDATIAKDSNRHHLTAKDSKWYQATSRYSDHDQTTRVVCW